MGTAIMKGLLNKNTSSSSYLSIEYTAWVRSQTSLERLYRALETEEEDRKRVHCVAGGDVVASVITPADVVILGFPPGELKAVFETSAGLADALRGKVIVSLLAGVSYGQLATVLRSSSSSSSSSSSDATKAGASDGDHHHVLRAIPSIGAKMNDSVTLIAETTTAAGHEQQKVTAWIFEQLGQIQWLPESLMDEATAAGAACNALTMVAIDAIVDASVAEGIPRPAAMKLAAASLRSSAGLLLSGGMTPESLKESMSVPKGITINSVLELERGHVRSATSDAVRHAIQYTRNMSA